MMEAQKSYVVHAEHLQPLLSATQELSSRIESLSSELHKLTSPTPGAPVRNHAVSPMYGYIEAKSLDNLTDSQKAKLESGLREFLGGGVSLTEPVGLDAWTAFSDRFIKFLEGLGLHVQKNWLGFTYEDTKKAGVNAHKLQALQLYHGYALESPGSLQWYISSRTMETFRMLCLVRGLL